MKNPFQGGGAVSVTDRLDSVRRFDQAELRAALKTPHLQATVKKAIESRLRKLERQA